jgi:hypothetical protein
MLSALPALANQSAAAVADHSPRSKECGKPLAIRSLIGNAGLKRGQVDERIHCGGPSAQAGGARLRSQRDM